MELLEDEFADLQAFTEASLGQIWLNKQDEVWNQYLNREKDDLPTRRRLAIISFLGSANHKGETRES